MPIITSIAITTFLTNLAIKGFDKAFDTGVEKVSEGALTWIKSLFFKNNEPKAIMKELQQEPENQELLNKALAIIENSIEDNSKHEEYIKEIFEKIPTITNTISNSKNINTGNVNTGGGSFRIGDSIE